MTDIDDVVQVLVDQIATAMGSGWQVFDHPPDNITSETIFVRADSSAFNQTGNRRAQATTMRVIALNNRSDPEETARRLRHLLGTQDGDAAAGVTCSLAAAVGWGPLRRTSGGVDEVIAQTSPQESSVIPPEESNFAEFAVVQCRFEASF